MADNPNPERADAFDQKTQHMYRAIGSAITSWAWVEDGLVKLLSTLLGCSLEQAGIVWYSVVSFPGKLEMIDSLLKHTHDGKPIMKYWPSCHDYLRHLSGHRNQLAHWELVLLRPHGVGGPPFGPSSEPRLVPHNFDVRAKMMRHRLEAGIGIEMVEFHCGTFNRIGSELRELWLACNDKIPWPDKFSQPLIRPQNEDELWPWSSGAKNDSPQSPHA